MSNSLKGINVCSICSGAGISEYYLANTNVQVALANEINSSRAKLYEAIYPDVKMICGDVTDPNVQNQIVQQYEELGCKMILGTPPCQSFAPVNTTGNKQNDQRQFLILPTLDIIRRTDPEYVIIENVPQFLTAHIQVGDAKIQIRKLIDETLTGLGYNVNIVVLDAADFGIPQHRKRAIVLASKHGFWPAPQKRDRQIRVIDVIGDLPSIEAGEDSGIKYHKAPSLPERHVITMRHTPSGGCSQDNKFFYPRKADGSRVKSFRQSYSRISWDKPAPTITTNNGSWGSQSTGHPGRLMPDGLYSDARVLSLLEILRLTGLPDDYPVPDWCSENLIRTCIGECFLPGLVKQLIETMPTA
ncbi:MAG: DNA cytosine methyltransferase [Alphaproteobacteria bacterium]|nr:DNA cytosine methyltransferase [Alphaproteobacteria bacterium]